MKWPDTFVSGFLLAAAITAVGAGIGWLLGLAIHSFNPNFTNFKVPTLAAMGLFLNIIVLPRVLKRGNYWTGRGMVAFAFVLLFYVMYQYYGHDLGIR